MVLDWDDGELKMGRLEFTAPTKRAAFKRSGGTCEAHLVRMLPGSECGARLISGNVFYEHVDPDALDGGNDLDNCACLCKTHWRLKTASYDLPVIAKNNRQRDRARGIKPQNYRPLTGTKRSGIKLAMNGAVLNRATGQPWRGR